MKKHEEEEEEEENEENNLRKWEKAQKTLVPR